MSAAQTLLLSEAEARALLAALPRCSDCREPAVLIYSGDLYCPSCAVAARANPCALMLRKRGPVVGRPRALPCLAVVYRLQLFLQALPRGPVRARG